MLKIADSRQMKEIDRRAQLEYGIPSLILMENAGIKAVQFLVETAWRRAIPGGLFSFLAGRGNNGGDALVMARQFFLQGKKELAIILANGEPEEARDPWINLGICRSLGIPVIDYTTDEKNARTTLESSLFIFDGMTGTGLKGEIEEPFKSIISFINSLPQPTISIDVPSGVSDLYKKDFTAVRADLTLAMGLPKRCLYLPDARPSCGTIVTIDLGFPPQLSADPSLPGELAEPVDFFNLLPPFPDNAHKGTRGHLAVFAGNVGTTGAALLSSQAAARCRTGLVTLYTDPASYPVVASQLVSVMCRPVTKDSLDFKEIEKKYDAMLIGPGLGLTTEKQKLFDELVKIKLPKVIDADGLTLLAAAKDLRNKTPLVLTPHPGELARLVGSSVSEVQSDPLAHAFSLSRRFDAVCVFKSHVTFISEPHGGYAVIDGMNPALGTGGSGDVLAGLIAAFLAQGIDAWTSARLGVLLHGKLGEYVFNRKGWFIAEDLIPYISIALDQKRGGKIWA